MKLAREINIKPSFMRELHALPVSMTDQVWEKINFLAQNPIPDGNLKKKLAKWSDVYRLRIGSYRLFYSFGSQWVRLLSIRPRKNAYRADIQYEEPTMLLFGDDLGLIDDEDLAAGYSAPPWDVTLEQSHLPATYTEAWIRSLNVPEEYVNSLYSCRTEDDLLASGVPDKYLERIIEALFPRPVQEIMQQPDFVVFDTNDLVRYREGDLMGFLLRLDSDQERLVDWALQGPALIKGGPGTGKSTIALYRVRALLDYGESRGKQNSILFTTYTATLCEFSRQLLQQLLGSRIRNVTIDTPDVLARRIVEEKYGPVKVAEREQLLDFLNKCMGNFPRIAVLRVEYLLDEIEWVIEGLGIKTLDEYLETQRIGRKVPFDSQRRREMWECYVRFNTLTTERNLWTPSQLRLSALDLVTAGAYVKRFDNVVIDEAQDLTPVSIRLLVELSEDSRGIYITADESQSIYARGFSWNAVHNELKVRGRTLKLKVNYRTTKEIADNAVAFLKTSGCGDADSLKFKSINTGPMPVLVGHSSDEEKWRLASHFLKQMTRHLRLPLSGSAVLIPNEEDALSAVEGLEQNQIKASFREGHDLSLQSQDVKVLSMKAAKGLEFPVVVMAGHDRLFVSSAADEIGEELDNVRRTVFVGLTRAMRGLMVLYDVNKPSVIVDELRQGQWFTGE